MYTNEDKNVEVNLTDDTFTSEMGVPVSYTHLDVYKRQLFFPFLLFCLQQRIVSIYIQTNYLS